MNDSMRRKLVSILTFIAFALASSFALADGPDQPNRTIDYRYNVVTPEVDDANRLRGRVDPSSLAAHRRPRVQQADWWTDPSTLTFRFKNRRGIRARARGRLPRGTCDVQVKLSASSLQFFQRRSQARFELDFAELGAGQRLGLEAAQDQYRRVNQQIADIRELEESIEADGEVATLTQYLAENSNRVFSRRLDAQSVYVLDSDDGRVSLKITCAKGRASLAETLERAVGNLIQLQALPEMADL